MDRRGFLGLLGLGASAPVLAKLGKEEPEIEEIEVEEDWDGFVLDDVGPILGDIHTMTGACFPNHGFIRVKRLTSGKLSI